MAYVITCGDEGIQINEGTRLGILGTGFELKGFSQVVKVLKRLLGKDLRIAANEENAWVKERLDLATWEQVKVNIQPQIEALAVKEKLLYSGLIPFADPRQLKHEIKGHMVRPKEVHIANKICFTLAGGEQTYNLGNYVISAEWVAQVDKKLAKDFLTTQVKFYQKQAKMELPVVFEMEGELGEKVAQKNKQVLENLGFKAS
ncbi:hypothetical protein KJ707_00535 [Patescibacteria group bacterium]|nr:hypothetical protein [Patescibacteria group bacterium]MBU1967140.1 hypothetical protein [Patescibacteria group bacterium]MBU2543042.1 hypothetical protein [Patescibacteria group bacterium]